MPRSLPFASHGRKGRLYSLHAGPHNLRGMKSSLSSTPYAIGGIRFSPFTAGRQREGTRRGEEGTRHSLLAAFRKLRGITFSPGVASRGGWGMRFFVYATSR